MHSLFLYDKYVFSFYIDGSSREALTTNIYCQLSGWEKMQVMEYMPT